MIQKQHLDIYPIFNDEQDLKPDEPLVGYTACSSTISARWSNTF
jgi:hypothetical protein